MVVRIIIFRVISLQVQVIRYDGGAVCSVNIWLYKLGLAFTLAAID